MARTSYDHIVLDDHGFPVIEGPTPRWSSWSRRSRRTASAPKSSSISCPTFLWARSTPPSPTNWDHREEINRDLERRALFAEELRRELGQPPLVARLKQRGLL